MTEAYLNKFDCLARAKTLMASGDAASLRYACLELRFCMEAVTCEKLRAYAPRLPPEVLSRWQPPQAVAALLELEDEAEQEYTVAIGGRRGETTGPMQGLGEHRTFAITWLRKHYNKLGNFLHVPNENAPGQRRQQVNPQELRQYLESVVEECEQVVESSITFTLALTVEFNCQLCRRKTVVNAKGAKQRGRISCWNPQCEAEYTVFTDEDGSICFRLRGWPFPCQACGHRIVVPSKRLVPGHQFACDACGRRHKLVKDRYYAVEIEHGGEV
jgi:transcription elongation factor Elf1